MISLDAHPDLQEQNKDAWHPGSRFRTLYTRFVSEFSQACAQVVFCCCHRNMIRKLITKLEEPDNFPCTREQRMPQSLQEPVHVPVWSNFDAVARRRCSVHFCFLGHSVLLGNGPCCDPSTLYTLFQRVRRPPSDLCACTAWKFDLRATCVLRKCDQFGDAGLGSGMRPDVSLRFTHPLPWWGRPGGMQDHPGLLSLRVLENRRYFVCGSSLVE